MTARTAVWLGLALGVLSFCGASPVWAHPLAPAVLSFEPAGPRSLIMSWRAPLKRPSGQSLSPRIPEGCVSMGPAKRELSEDQSSYTEVTTLSCASADLLGVPIHVDGFEDSSLNAVLRIRRPSGEIRHAILDSSQRSFTLLEAETQAHSRTFWEYLQLGVDHLLLGWDHLVFVFGLMFLFGWRRRLILAVTAFTLGHSLTLALSVLELVRLPQASVEVLIALTIIVLALEIRAGHRGPVWRHPWILPSLLGLLHGLGFASVLTDAGIPSPEIPLALLGFNLGIELAQLLLIGGSWLAYGLVRPLLPDRWRANRLLPAYITGSLGAFWFIERALALLTLGG
jgi:hydrogenase/urease accessory protein HupE